MLCHYFARNQPRIPYPESVENDENDSVNKNGEYIPFDPIKKYFYE